MKKLLLLLSIVALRKRFAKTLIHFSLFICYFSQAQNLVPNPSFEYYTSCPSGLAEVFLSPPWFDPTNATSDYYNTCSIGTNISIPKNYYGYQFPYNGNAYMGFATYEGSVAQNWREYIGVKLISPLEKDSDYCFSAYISPAGHFTKFANNIGILLLTDTIGIHSYYPTNILYTPNANYDTLISDTLNWRLINLNFRATSICNYLIIGNFKLDMQTNLQNNNANGFDGAYTYIDSVILSKCNSAGIGIEQLSKKNNQININPNPTSDQFYIETNATDKLNVDLFDVNGRHVFSTSVMGKSNISVATLDNGIYTMTIKTVDRVINKKLVIVH